MPLVKLIVGLMCQAAQGPRAQSRPLFKSAIDEVIRLRQDWKEQVVLRLAWVTASRWGEIAVLTTTNLLPQTDESVTLV